MKNLLLRLATPAVAVAVCATLALLTVRPAVTATGTADSGDRLAFDTTVLNQAERSVSRTQRPVAPALERIRPWISAVGAAVALADLDGDQAENEVCLVDPRDDSVRVFGAPGARSALRPARLDVPGSSPSVAPMGCVPADLDEDGDTDLLVYYWGRPPAAFLNVDGNWRFEELVRPTEIWNTTALNVADIDGDDHLDILVGNYFPDGAKVLDVTATDDDRMAMQDSMSLARNAGRNRLLLTRPSGPDRMPTLVDASVAFPKQSAESWTLAFGAQDLTGEGKPELYVANDFGPDQLLVNHSTPGRVDLRLVNGRRDLATPKSMVLGHDSFKGMGVAFTHLGGDPRPSIAVSNITTPYALHEANLFFEPDGDPKDLLGGRSIYRQGAEARGLSRGGWSWDIKAADFDNDGTEELIQATGFVAGRHNRWPELQELAMSNDTLLKHPAAWLTLGPADDLSGHEPNRLWTLQPSGRYLDRGRSSGIGLEDVSRGFAIGDLNDDGRADVLVANQWGDSRLHLNTGGDGSAVWLRLRYPAGSPGSGATRAAIGASVRLDTPAGAQFRQVFPANGHAGVSASSVHFGLGDQQGGTATISWLAGGTQHTAKVPVRPGAHQFILNPNGTVTAA